jgi:hypothetical protein
MSDTTAEAPLAGEARDFEARQRAAPGSSPTAEAVTAGPTINIGSDGGTVPIVPVLLIGFGGYLMWFAIHYWRGQGAAVWPSYPIKSVLQGKGIPPNTPAPPVSQEVAAYEQGIGQESQSGGGKPPGGPPPTGSAQHMAKLLLPRYGWGPTELAPLILLWNRESGWRNCAYNVSGAYGIAQALGHGSGACAVGPRCDGASTPGLNCSYGGFGQSVNDSKQANAGNILRQIEWGLNYIKSQYQTPSAAWAHEQQFGWY